MTFDAIRIVDGVADVVEEKCVACGALRQGLSS
jgi:Fe-S-cluster-containing hydrogenase component 2